MIGLFQTLVALYRPDDRPLRLLDAGSGMGLLALAADPFVREGGTYVGIDVNEEWIELCRGRFPAPPFFFECLDTVNAQYAPQAHQEQVPWPVEGSSFDLVMALSLWTHLRSDDAFFYLREAARVLRPGGHVILTAFVLDDEYFERLGSRGRGESSYHGTPRERWVFSDRCAEDPDWRHPGWARPPEKAIGITAGGLARLYAQAGLELGSMMPGNWREAPGLYFQDILVLRKSEEPVRPDDS